MTPSFYFHARRMAQGKAVELAVYNGTHAGTKKPLGALTFDVGEWETFRPVLIAAMRVAGYARIPMEFSDQTRVKDNGEGVVKLVH